MATLSVETQRTQEHVYLEVFEVNQYKLVLVSLIIVLLMSVIHQDILSCSWRSTHLLWSAITNYWSDHL